jgi:hypothetical protein
MKTFLQGIVGSTAYGLATPLSDVDRMGVYIAPTSQIVSFHPPKESIVTNKPDITVHEVGKFLSLVLRCNPSVTELLWLSHGRETGTDYEDYEVLDGPWGWDLIYMRESFLSAPLVKNAYLGYATQQFQKLISRGDGTFGPDLAKRTQKHARHLRRLVEQGFEMYTTGSLTVQVADPEGIHEVGRRVEADPEVAIAYMARAEANFADVKSCLPEHPDEEKAERWLVHLRKQNWEI